MNGENNQSVANGPVIANDPPSLLCITETIDNYVYSCPVVTSSQALSLVDYSQGFLCAIDMLRLSKTKQFEQYRQARSNGHTSQVLYELHSLEVLHSKDAQGQPITNNDGSPVLVSALDVLPNYSSFRRLMHPLKSCSTSAEYTMFPKANWGTGRDGTGPEGKSDNYIGLGLAQGREVMMYYYLKEESPLVYELYRVPPTRRYKARDLHRLTEKQYATNQGRCMKICEEGARQRILGGALQAHRENNYITKQSQQQYCDDRHEENIDLLRDPLDIQDQDGNFHGDETTCDIRFGDDEEGVALAEGNNAGLKRIGLRATSNTVSVIQFQNVFQCGPLQSAASTIQAYWRRYIAMLRYAAAKTPSKIIQAAWRRHIVISRYAVAKTPSKVIQAAWRRVQAARYVQTLLRFRALYLEVYMKSFKRTFALIRLQRQFRQRRLYLEGFAQVVMKTLPVIHLQRRFRRHLYLKQFAQVAKKTILVICLQRSFRRHRFAQLVEANPAVFQSQRWPCRRGSKLAKVNLAGIQIHRCYRGTRRPTQERIRFRRFFMTVCLAIVMHSIWARKSVMTIR